MRRDWGELGRAGKRMMKTFKILGGFIYYMMEESISNKNLKK